MMERLLQGRFMFNRRFCIDSREIGRQRIVISMARQQ